MIGQMGVEEMKREEGQRSRWSYLEIRFALPATTKGWDGLIRKVRSSCVVSLDIDGYYYPVEGRRKGNVASYYFRSLEQ